MSVSRLIVNADDFGMSRGITDAVIAAHRYGILTSTSLMSNMPAAEYALERLARFPRLGAGVHLNICAGRPLLPPSEIPTLVGANGQFHPPRVVIRRLCTGRASGRDIFAEFRAQIRWMKERGVEPTHADSHHHMHLYPCAVLAFARALKSEGIPCARAPRCVVWTGPYRQRLAERLGGPHEGSLWRRVLVRSYRDALQFGPFRELQMPSARLSFCSRDRHDLDSLRQCWRTALANPRSGTFELTCHPGFFERGFSEADAIRAQREEELHWLTSADIRSGIEQTGIELINYRELAESRAAQTASRRIPALP